jgi:hypothetical protein
MGADTDVNSAPPLGISRFDSATGMLQALAAHLHGHPFGSLSGSHTSDRLLKIGNALPRSVRTLAYALAALNEAAPRSQAHTIDAEQRARWACGLYPARRYAAIFIGSSNGAMLHLCAALSVPWLPQTFLALVRQLLTDPNDAAEGLRRGLPTFNDIPSQRAALAYLQARPSAFDDIRLALFSHGTRGIGLADIADWNAVLSDAGCTGAFLGVDPDKYPSDFATLARYQIRHPAAASPSAAPSWPNAIGGRTDAGCPRKGPLRRLPPDRRTRPAGFHSPLKHTSKAA